MDETVDIQRIGKEAVLYVAGKGKALKLAMTRTDNPLGSVYLEYNIYLNANQ